MDAAVPAPAHASTSTPPATSAAPPPASTLPEARALPELEREIGRVRGAAPGACVVVVAGIHGNEPAGVRAAQRVLARLAQVPPPSLRGDVVVFAGNLRSLRRGQRFEGRDLNRGWHDDALAALRARDPATLSGEDAEQRELHDVVEGAFAQARGARVLVDLHTSSAPGIPFVLFGDTVAQCAFVRALPIPLLLGLVEQVDGILADHFTSRGAITFCVEGGQHDDPVAEHNLEAALWLSLAQAGVIDDASPEVARSRAHLDAARAGLPHFLEVVSRHAITPDDAFVMEPGFKNISSVERGRLLARDRRGAICAPDDGAVVLPLYQKLGSDGFFWAREVSERRLRLAALARRLPVDALVRRLPGIAGHDAHSVVVSDAVAVTPVTALLRLLGYRRERRAGGRRVLARAPQ
jgi:succinylglutamate desuccinylase